MWLKSKQQQQDNKLEAVKVKLHWPRLNQSQQIYIYYKAIKCKSFDQSKK